MIFNFLFDYNVVFIQNEMKKEGHEFVEILSNYFRARHQLTGTEEDVKELQKKYAELQEEWWIQHTRNAVASVSDSIKEGFTVATVI